MATGEAEQAGHGALQEGDVWSTGVDSGPLPRATSLGFASGRLLHTRSPTTWRSRAVEQRPEHRRVPKSLTDQRCELGTGEVFPAW